MTDGSSSFSLGSASASIVLDLSALQADIKRAQSMFESGLDRIGSSLQNFGNQMSDLGGALTKLTAPIAAVGVTGVKVAADFQTLMKQIENFGGLTGKELEDARKHIIDLGKATVFSQEEVGQAMLDLLKSGMSYKQATAALPKVLDLATAGGLRLADAAGIVSSAMAQFGLEAKDAGRITDALAKAANASRADVADLGAGLANTGPIAAQFGLSIEDTAAVLGVFSNVGIMGAEAGTQLKSMLLNLSRPTDKVKEAMQKLGVSLYDNNGKVKNFNTFIKELDTALKKLPIEQQNEMMQTLAGSYGITGLAALRASGGIDDMRKKMKAAPSASKLAASAAQTFNFALESLQGSIQALQTEALTPLMEKVLTPFVNQLTGVINQITDWTTKNPVLTQTIVSVLGVVTALGPALWIAGQMFSAVGTVIGSVGALFGFILSPIGLVIAAVAALGIAWTTNFGGIRDTIDKAWNNVIKPILVELGKAFGLLPEKVSPLTDNIKLLQLAAQGAWDKISAAFNQFMSSFSGIRDAVMPIIDTIRNAFNTLFGGTLTYVVKRGDNLTRIAQQFGTTWQELAKLNDIKNPNLILPGQELQIPDKSSVFDRLGKAAQEAIPRLKEEIGKLLDALVQFIVDNASKFLSGFATVLGQVGTWLTNGGLQQVAQGLLNFISQAADWFITYGWPALKRGIEGLWNAIRDFIQSDGVARFITGLTKVIGDAANWVLDTGLPKLLKSVVDMIAGIVTWLQDSGKGGAGEFVKGIGAALQSAINWVKTEGIPKAVDVFNQLVDAVGKVFDRIGIALANGVLDAINRVPGLAKLLGLPEGYNFKLTPGGFEMTKRDWGGIGMKNMPYLITPKAGNEVFVPQTNGFFLPHFDQIMAQLAGGNNNGITIENLTIQANSRAEGAAAADSFAARLDEIRARRGW